MTNSTENILNHSRCAKLPISFGGETIEFMFRFTRSDIADFYNDMSKMPELDCSRKWTLNAVDPVQREQYLQIINSPDNLSVEREVMKLLTPFLRKNGASIGELTIES